MLLQVHVNHYRVVSSSWQFSEDKADIPTCQNFKLPIFKMEWYILTLAFWACDALISEPQNIALNYYH